MQLKDTQVISGNEASQLRRDMTIADVVALGVSASVGVSIFSVFSPATQLAGPAVLLALALGLVPMCVFLVVYSVLAAVAPTSGSSFVWPARFVHLGEAQKPFQPRPLPGSQRRAQQSHHQVDVRPMQHSPLDLDHRPHPNGMQTFQIQHPPQHQVGLRPRMPPGRGVTGLQRKPEQLAGVQGAVVVGVGR